MQDKQNNLLVNEWLKKADDDERNAHSLLTHKDGVPSGACLFSHQMAEKNLKAFLVHKKKRHPKTHNLSELTELCSAEDPSFLGLKEEVVHLDPFYTPSRYPGDYPELTWRDAEQAFEAAKKIKEFVAEKIEDENRPPPTPHARGKD